ncbi:hypothetical protein CHS0354_003714 [Potamilus streckersoni]|uniref:Ubiquitin-like domain-containing protein n=1 Tax=Potamilus streckersoni TaxID=2493646 RepID=A0AAE0W117_9BIVA|nr:hypothetical protein CHS0354_003714 [Potamilus streckersoni]
MLVFGVHEGERVSVDVPIGTTVGDVKKIMQEKLNIYFDELVKQDKKILVLSYAGSDLDDSWVFTDLGIVPGSTIRVCMKEEVKPVLFVSCSHNNEMLEIIEDYNVERLLVDDLRTIVAKKTGLPLTIFRLTTISGKDMFDRHILMDYDIECGNTVKMECWDGWTEFINMSIMGHTPRVISLLAQDEIQSRFQMKVSLYIAAHYGCVDLAKAMIRGGARPDEPVGEHPSRMWCSELSHIESQRAPVHEAAEFGQLGVLRIFVNHDITCSMAREGHNLTPLNLALRKGQKACASLLLTKQWTRVPVTKTQSITLQTLRKIKLWSERAKEKAFMKFGPNASSLKRRSFNTGPLVSHGVILDGFSQSPMMGQKKIQKEKENIRRVPEIQELDPNSPEKYFRNLTALQTYGPKFRQNTKWGKMIGKATAGLLVGQGLKNLIGAGAKVIENKEKEDKVSSGSPEPIMKDSGSDDKDETRSTVKFPSVLPRSRLVSLSSQIIPVQKRPAEKDEKDAKEPETTEAAENKGRKYRKTGSTKSKNVLSASTSNIKIGKDGETTRASHPVYARSESTRSVKSDKNSTVSKRSSRSKRHHLPSEMLMSNAKKAVGGVPLPIVSNEGSPRPFYYFQGKREDQIVQPLLNAISSHQGSDPRERAIKTLAIANTFKDKPWLVRVRMAMGLTASTMKREVTNLRHSFIEYREKPVDNRSNASALM